MIMFWVAVLAISVLLYVLLDGFDLGVGILFGMTRDKEQRGAMLRAVSPVWDGNETWLVVTGVVLWGPFPLVYATLLSAFYLPLLLMLAGLILRGVTFEFRARAQGSRWVWDIAFAGGSLIATFPGSDSWRLGRGSADHRGPLLWRRFRVDQSIRAAVRCGTLPWIPPSQGRSLRDKRDYPFPDKFISSTDQISG